MRRRVFLLVLIIVITIFSLHIYNDNYVGTKKLSFSSVKLTTISIAPKLSSYRQNVMVKQFIEDANLPITIYEEFLVAIQGDKKAQEWIDEFKDASESKIRSALSEVFPFRSVDNPYSENESYYNIGMLYYYGDEYIPLKENKEKAFYWLKLSAEKGSFLGAITSGDMAKSGEGIPINQKTAFDYYEKAQEYYFLGALDGNIAGLYKLIALTGISPMQSILLSKAASSMDYSGEYFDMVYEGLDSYSISEEKLRVVDYLDEAWNKGIDTVAVQLKKVIQGNKYYSKDFVEELIKTSYTYSYHAFAEKYGIMPNRDFEDGKKIQFDFTDIDEVFDLETMAKQYLEYEECEFYELDFDGDGEDEIGIPIYSGAGGAFMIDNFEIYKKNKAGLYEAYAGGPSCTMRDAMRLIEFDGRIYFITNPFSDTKNAPHDITARLIDDAGEGHEISVFGKEYKPKEIMTQVNENYDIDEFDGFMSEIMTQADEAISTTKRHEMYNPNNTKQLTEELQDFSVDSYMDVYFIADVDNDEVKEYIRKGHIINQDKYYDDFNLFQIYDSEYKLLENTESMLDILPDDEYYGLHSGGNIYDILPIAGKIVQFWTYEKNNKTYCIALTRNELLYGLHVYSIENDKPIPIFQSLLFDEVQDIEIFFSEE